MNLPRGLVTCEVPTLQYLGPIGSAVFKFIEYQDKEIFSLIRKPFYDNFPSFKDFLWMKILIETLHCTVGRDNFRFKYVL